MKLTAHELCAIIDTFDQSLRIANWGGCYTYESREKIRNKIGEIMNEIKIEVVTDQVEFAIDADSGI